jgi:hypothetical protein
MKRFDAATAALETMTAARDLARDTANDLDER